MSTKERKKKDREEVLDTTITSDLLDHASVSTITPQSNQTTISETNEQIDDPKSKFIGNLPKWVNKPWMYIIPTHQSHQESWKESWRNVILDYSEIFNLHIISITDLLGEYPFDNPSIRKNISKSGLTKIIDDMESMGLAKWLDNNRIMVRVYFRTLDQWKDIIVNFLFEYGYAAEIITIFELENMGQQWSDLPRNDFQEIFNSLVSSNRARWADSNKDSIKFEL